MRAHLTQRNPASESNQSTSVSRTWRSRHLASGALFASVIKRRSNNRTIDRPSPSNPSPRPYPPRGTARVGRDNFPAAHHSSRFIPCDGKHVSMEPEPVLFQFSFTLQMILELGLKGSNNSPLWRSFISTGVQ